MKIRLRYEKVEIEAEGTPAEIEPYVATFRLLALRTMQANESVATHVAQTLANRATSH